MFLLRLSIAAARQYSLEGHQFAVFGFCLTSDYRYVVSISNKFITWDLSTSDMARDVNPGIEGIMQQLVLSPDNRYAAAYTNNNQVRSSSILSSSLPTTYYSLFTDRGPQHVDERVLRHRQPSAEPRARARRAPHEPIRLCLWQDALVQVRFKG